MKAIKVLILKYIYKIKKNLDYYSIILYVIYEYYLRNIHYYFEK